MNKPKRQQGLARIIGKKPSGALSEEDIGRAYDPATGKWDPCRQVAINLRKDHELEESLAWCDRKIQEFRLSERRWRQEDSESYGECLDDFLGRVKELLKGGLE